MQMIGQRIMFDLRMQVFEHLQRLDVRFYDRNPVGRLMTRVTTDVDVLNELFTSGVVSVFGDAFTLVGIMAVLIWMDWRLAPSPSPSCRSS
jgi:ATP-binding cassette subfamily B protein